MLSAAFQWAFLAHPNSTLGTRAESETKSSLPRPGSVSFVYRVSNTRPPSAQLCASRGTPRMQRVDRAPTLQRCFRRGPLLAFLFACAHDGEQLDFRHAEPPVSLEPLRSCQSFCRIMFHQIGRPYFHTVTSNIAERLRNYRDVFLPPCCSPLRETSPLLSSQPLHLSLLLIITRSVPLNFTPTYTNLLCQLLVLTLK